MLHSELLNKELEEKGAEFKRYLEKQKEAVAFLPRCARNLEEMPQGGGSSGSVRSKILPPFPPASWRRVTLPFAQSWQNHEQARAWAMEVLKDRTTFAADGSQLYLEKETSLPIGAVPDRLVREPAQRHEQLRKECQVSNPVPGNALAAGRTGDPRAPRR